MNKSIELLARILLGQLFLLAGLSKLGEGYSGTAAYMESMAIPGELLPLVIGTEIAGGLMIIAGYKTRWAAYALAGFSILSGLIFHLNPADQMQMILLMKNVSIAGGLLLLSTYGAGDLSMENKLLR